MWEGAQLNVIPFAQLPRLVRATLSIPGHFFVFSLGMDEAKTIKEREGKINYMPSSLNLILKENKVSIQEAQAPMEEPETPGDEKANLRSK